jgi:hypothetical protein
MARTGGRNRKLSKKAAAAKAAAAKAAGTGADSNSNNNDNDAIVPVAGSSNNNNNQDEEGAPQDDIQDDEPHDTLQGDALDDEDNDKDANSDDDDDDDGNNADDVQLLNSDANNDTDGEDELLFSGVYDIADDDDDGDEEDDIRSDNNIAKMMVDTDTFMTALQDEGRRADSDDPSKGWKYPGIDQLGKAMWKGINSVLKDKKANATRESKALSRAIALLRNEEDILSVAPSLQKHRVDGNDRIFVVSNDEFGGQKMIIENYLNKFLQNKTKPSKRDGSLAVRVIAALCHPDVRDGVKYWLRRKKTRTDQDQSHNTVLAFMEQVKEIFLDPDLEISRPDEMDLDDHDPKGKIDPMNCDFSGKDAKWILDCYTDYIKPKLKKAFKKWYKNTGGGSRSLDNFINYSNDEDKTMPWLTWVYAIDESTGGILQSYSGVKRPRGFRIAEAGFEHVDDFDFSGEEDEVEATLNGSLITPAASRRKPRSGKKRGGAASDIKNAMETSQNGINEVVDLLKDHVAKSTTAVDPIGAKFEEIEKVEQHKRRVEEDSDYEPDQKNQLLAILKSKKIKLGKDIIELHKKDDDA